MPSRGVCSRHLFGSAKLFLTHWNSRNINVWFYLRFLPQYIPVRNGVNVSRLRVISDCARFNNWFLILRDSLFFSSKSIRTIKISRSFNRACCCSNRSYYSWRWTWLGCYWRMSTTCRSSSIAGARRRQTLRFTPF